MNIKLADVLNDLASEKHEETALALDCCIKLAKAIVEDNFGPYPYGKSPGMPSLEMDEKLVFEMAKWLYREIYGIRDSGYY